MTEEDKSPVDAAVEFAVYAPIGFALEARRLLPSFVERGRQQVNMAKVVGKFAVTHGQARASVQLTQVQERAAGILAEFGLLGEPSTPATPPQPEGAVASATAEAPAAASEPAPDAGDLPISGYDSLAASQVIPRLEGLSSQELDAVRRYELGHRGRKTILGKITQLTGG